MAIYYETAYDEYPGTTVIYVDTLTTQTSTGSAVTWWRHSTGPWYSYDIETPYVAAGNGWMAADPRTLLTPGSEEQDC